MHGEPRRNPRPHDLLLIEPTPDLRSPRLVSGATTDLFVDRRETLLNGRAHGGGLAFERDGEEADRLWQAIALLMRLTRARARDARDRPALRPMLVNVRLRSTIGRTASIASAGFPLARSARNSGTLSEIPAVRIGGDGIEQELDANRGVGGALGRGEPCRRRTSVDRPLPA